MLQCDEEARLRELEESKVNARERIEQLHEAIEMSVESAKRYEEQTQALRVPIDTDAEGDESDADDSPVDDERMLERANMAEKQRIAEIHRRTRSARLRGQKERATLNKLEKERKKIHDEIEEARAKIAEKEVELTEQGIANDTKRPQRAVERLANRTPSMQGSSAQKLPVCIASDDNGSDVANASTVALSADAACAQGELSFTVDSALSAVGGGAPQESDPSPQPHPAGATPVRTPIYRSASTAVKVNLPLPMSRKSTTRKSNARSTGSVRQTPIEKRKQVSPLVYSPYVMKRLSSSDTLQNLQTATPKVNSSTPMQPDPTKAPSKRRTNVFDLMDDDIF